MAKQTGPVFITGTYNGICFYKLGGKHYARRRSSLSGKRVKKDPAFQLTMVYAGMFAQASAIAAEVYRDLPARSRQVALYRAMTSQANGLLKKGIDATEIKKQLTAQHHPTETPSQTITSRPVTQNTQPHTPAKSIRILSARLVKRPLLRDRNGALHVSMQGLTANTTPNGITTLRARRQSRFTVKAHPPADR
ncbi:hypothetical protein F0L74_32030 [Chitinophaga agrisoli]|uniref:Uncharacterized protein n=1 Tax=Chitinophaga agrisoli TaxID=2607653 RepID=A0A5B2VRF9_9BACT|nr:hypothetical protein [Chitinophaga agrisoli]KAA2240767.1 hypothetical protein F0L74_32030 [Chitinophaga agrisoli]